MPNAEPPSILVVSCSEPGLEAALAALLGDHYSGLVVERIAIPGGSWWLARAGVANNSKMGKWVLARLAAGFEEAMRGVLARPSVSSIELIGHEGCHWYRDLDPRRDAADLVRQQGKDLLLAAAEVGRWTSAHVRARFLLEDGSGGYTSRSLV